MAAVLQCMQSCGGDNRRTMQQLIWSFLNHYDYENAIFLGELFFAESMQSDTALHLLATAYYRSGQVMSAYLLLSKHGHSQSAALRFLYTRCCLELDKLGEAELVVRGDTLSTRDASKSGSVFTEQLAADLYRRTSRPDRALQSYSSALRANPFAWSALRRRSIMNHPIELSELHVPAELLKTDQKATTTATLNTSAALPAMTEHQKRCTSATPTKGTTSSKPPPGRQSVSATKAGGRSGGSSRASSAMSISPTSGQTRRSARILQLQHASSVKENSEQMIIEADSPTKRLTQRNSEQRMKAMRKKTPGAVTELNKRNSPKTSPIDANLEDTEEEDPPAIDAPKRARLVDSYTETDASLLPVVWQCCLHSESVPSVCADENTAGTSSDERVTLLDMLDVMKRYAKIAQLLEKFECRNALREADSLSELHQFTGWILTARARAHYYLGEYDMAAKQFELSRQHSEHYIRGLELYSNTLWHLQREADLSQLAQDLSTRFRSAPETWCAVGDCFSAQKDHETAVAFIGRAIQLDSDFAHAYALLGFEHSALDNDDAALQAYRAALDRHPRHYTAWYGMGKVYLKRGKLQLAEEHMRRALTVNPHNAFIVGELSELLQRQSRFEDALRLVNRALSVNTKVPYLRYQKAQCLAFMRRYNDALTEIDDLKRLAPTEAKVYLLAGKVHKKLQRDHIALMHFSWATDLDARGGTAAGNVCSTLDDEPVTALATTTSDNATAEATTSHAGDDDDARGPLEGPASPSGSEQTP